MSHRGVGAEHPINDRAQVVFVLVFFVVWIVDNFVLHFAVNVFGLVFLFASVPVGAAFLAVGVYFVRKSGAVVFSNTEGKVIDSGVYSYVRHPMYLGTLLILLGLTVATLSVLSFIVWVMFFVVYDKMAAYEEHDLSRILGQQYADYLKRVPKWVPARRSK